MEKQVYDAPTPIKQIRPQVPQPVATIVTKLLQKKPDRRYQSAKELLRDLNRAARGLGKSTGSDVSPEPESVRITSFRLRVPVRRSGFLSRSMLWLFVPALIAGAAYYAIRHMNRAKRAFARGRQYEAAQSLEDAERAYSEVVRIAGRSSELGRRADERLAAIHGQMDEREKRNAARLAVQAAEVSAAAGGTVLRKAFEDVEAIALSGAIGREVAADALRRLREQLETEAEAELSRRMRSAEHLVAEHRYAEAIKTIEGLPGTYARTAAAEQARSSADDVRARARSDFKDAAEKAQRISKRAAARGTPADEAIKLLLPFIHRSGLPDIASEARDLRIRIEQQAREARRTQQNTVTESRLEKLERQLAQSAALAHVYRFAESRAMVRSVQNYMRELGHADRVPQLDQRVRLIGRAEVLFATFEQALEGGKLNGTWLRLPEVRANRIAGYRRAERAIELGTRDGRKAVTPLGRLKAATILALMRKIDLRPYDHVVLAEFSLDHGLLEDARREIASAPRVKHKERAFANAVKARVEETRSAASPDDEDAASLLSLAIETVGSGQTGRAREWLTILKTRYRRTPSATDARLKKLEEAIARAGAEGP
jgi:hypothetical protein